MNYRDAGVDIRAADGLVAALRLATRGQFPGRVISGPGGVRGLYRIPGARAPYLAATCDGVGTKALLAARLGFHETIGVDLVAMNVNDLVTCGARPAFFLDYFAAGRLSAGRDRRLLAGVLRGCRMAGCALLGGETAEMPDLYRRDEYDLAGFAVGFVSPDRVIDGSRVRPGDVLLGIPSSGLHSNGFSLVRKALTPALLRRHADTLLVPTRLYVKEVLGLARRVRLHGVAHLTGGGWHGHLRRVLPAGCRAIVRKEAWPVPPIFRLVQKAGRVPEQEMYRTFNMGIGMLLILSPRDVQQVRRMLRTTYEVGSVAAGTPGVELR